MSRTCRLPVEATFSAAQVDIVRRHELALLDVDDAAGAAGCEQQVGLAAEERGDLQDVGRLRRPASACAGSWMSVRIGKPCVFDAGQDAQAFLQPGAAIGVDAGAVGLVEGGLEDERPGDPAGCSRAMKVDVLFAFDDARSGDQHQRAAGRRMANSVDADRGSASRFRAAGYPRLAPVARARGALAAALALLEAAPMKALNSGCGSMRLGLELGMELAAQVPGMVGELADLDVGAVGRLAGDAQAGGLQAVLVLAVEFVAVPVALADFARRRRRWRAKLPSASRQG